MGKKRTSSQTEPTPADTAAASPTDDVGRRTPKLRHARLVHFLSNDTKRRELSSEGIRFSIDDTQLNTEEIHVRLRSLGDAADGAVFVWKPNVEAALVAKDEHWAERLQASEQRWAERLACASELQAKQALLAATTKAKVTAPYKPEPTWQSDAVHAATQAYAASAQATITRLESEIAPLQQQVTTHAQRHDKLTTALARAECECTRLEAKMQTCEGQLADATTMRDAFQAAWEKLKNDLKESEQQREHDAVVSRAEIEASKAATVAEQKKVEAKTIAHEKEVVALKNSMAKLERELSDTETTLERDIKQLTTECVSVEHERDVAADARDTLEEQMRELKNAVAHYGEQLVQTARGASG